jgi:hypothetical protein
VTVGAAGQAAARLLFVLLAASPIGAILGALAIVILSNGTKD